MVIGLEHRDKSGFGRHYQSGRKQSVLQFSIRQRRRQQPSETASAAFVSLLTGAHEEAAKVSATYNDFDGNGASAD
ncbi:hypothetical protein D3879_10560 [Pseudomonas cavernicola]|uniref:Uncharacterized protein n=1 Tax=Pseudomonas cavernicola TaxID=2320866 RepID=A0A418XMH0_9PSED|nr:hypothetical protein D3879_10560 [Pseudomonas cavernicola]